MTDFSKLSRLLLGLKTPEDFLRQYPQLAARLAAALEKAGKPVTGGESSPSGEM